jgi:DNA-binding transcriptional regulator YhcF (GntR family)
VEIRLDASSAGPESGRLRSSIAREVEAGRLAPGERLPTVRALAGTLGLAPNTVAKAYRALEDAGLLVGRGRHGTFVAERLPAPPDEGDRRLAEAAEAFAARARQLGFDRAEALRAARRALEDPPAG